MVFVSFQHGCLCFSSVTPVRATSFSLLEILIIWKHLIATLFMDVIRSRKSTAVLCSLLCDGNIVKDILMSVESSSKLSGRMDETFALCQYRANNGRHGSRVISV